MEGLRLEAGLGWRTPCGQILVGCVIEGVVADRRSVVWPDATVTFALRPAPNPCVQNRLGEGLGRGLVVRIGA